MDHREALESEFPECRERICILSEVSGDPLSDIGDPVRTNFIDAELTAQRILDDVQKAYKPLMDLARRNQAARAIINPKK